VLPVHGERAAGIFCYLDSVVRRRLLALGVLLVLATGPRRVIATTGEVETSGYGGTTTGGWICGPPARVAYGGIGGEVRVAERAPTAHDGEGWNGKLGISFERQKTEVGSCTGQYCTPSKIAPPTTVLMGTHLRGGWFGRYGGVGVGVGMYEGWSKNTDESPRVQVYPELEARAGKSGPISAFGVIGVGSPLVTTMQRPGAYLGLTIASDGGLGGDFRLGMYRSGAAVFDQLAKRADLALRVRLLEPLALRVGGAVAEAGVDPDYEGSVGLLVGF
jgi:hypothetical protein